MKYITNKEITIKTTQDRAMSKKARIQKTDKKSAQGSKLFIDT